MRRIVNVLAVTLVAAMLAGCGPTPKNAAQVPAGGEAGEPPWTSCAAEVPGSAAASADVTALPRLADNFVPANVIVCGEQPERRADGGQDMVATESRADDVAALVAALRLPDAPPNNGSCTLDLPGVPWFAVLDAQGRWVRPGLPLDECGKIRIEVRDAVAGLKLTRLKTRVISELESGEAAASGCGQTSSDLVSAHSGGVTFNRLTDAPRWAGKQVRLCTYRVPAKEKGLGKPTGQLTRGAVLPADRTGEIEKALKAAGAARTCGKHASQFAVLAAADGSSETVYVELDGCQRILVDGPSGRPALGQGGAALTGLLNR
ncbi:MAG TPA: hypothetical protein VF755_23955 [Catenuloplanes sp.]